MIHYTAIWAFNTQFSNGYFDHFRNCDHQMAQSTSADSQIRQFKGMMTVKKSQQ